MIEIKESKLSDIDESPNMSMLFQEYADECALEELPLPYPKTKTYKPLEDAGVLTVFCAYLNDELIGFATLLAYHSHHYDLKLATTESIFVTKRHRKSGAGLKLIRSTEDKARSLGSPALLVTAPLGGSLAKILPSLDYNLTNLVFIKRLSNV